MLGVREELEEEMEVKGTYLAEKLSDGGGCGAASGK